MYGFQRSGIICNTIVRLNIDRCSIHIPKTEVCVTLYLAFSTHIVQWIPQAQGGISHFENTYRPCKGPNIHVLSHSCGSRSEDFPI